MKYLRSLIILITIPTSLMAAGPWPQPKNQGYFKLSEWWTIFDQHYTDTGHIDPNVTTGIFNTTLYAEYGINNRITALTNFTLFSRNYMNNLRSETTNAILIKGEALNALGDLDLGLKYGITKPGAKIPVSISLILGLPTGKSSGGTLNNLQTGDGEFNQILQIDAGKSFNIFKKTPAYLSSYIGINNRTKDFSEEIRLGLEFGIGLINKRLWLNTKLNIVESLKNGATAETVNSTSIFANNTEFTSIAVEANLYLNKHIGISGNVAGALRGEIIAAALSYSVGIFYDMNK